MKVTWKKELPIGNRDGNLFLVQAENGNCYLVLEAESLHNEEVFEGMGSTEHFRVPESAILIIHNYHG